MNPRTLPVKRRPVPNGFFKRIHAVTRNRNQRVAATATAEDLEEDHSARISRGFTIIFLIHVVAIALYFIHLNFLNDHSVAKATLPAATETATSPKPRIDNPPILGAADATCIVVAGDNYARIAAREGVDEDALRAANQNKPIAAGLTFKLPPKRIVAKDSPMVVALRKQAPSNAERGLVEPTAVEPSEPQRPLLVHPKVVHETPPPKIAAREVATNKSAKETAAAKSAKETSAAKSTKENVAAKSAKETTAAKSAKEATAAKSAKETAAAKSTKETAAAKAAHESGTAKATPGSSKQTYVVKSGDNVYRISKHYKIDQAALLRANNISDPAKLNTGMTLVIPH